MGIAKRDITYSVRELRSLPMALSEMGTPTYLRGPQFHGLSDGSMLKLTDDQLNEIRSALINLDHSRDSWDKPLVAGGCLFLPNATTHNVRWLPLIKLPAGAHVLNDFWVYRDTAGGVEAKMRYPENPDVIAENWRLTLSRERLAKDENQPKVEWRDDLHKGTKEIDPRLPGINRMLNRDIENQLEKGIPLSDAIRNVRRGHEEVLKVLLMGYADAFSGLGALSKDTPSLPAWGAVKKRLSYSGGPSILGTYMNLRDYDWPIGDEKSKTAPMDQPDQEADHPSDVIHHSTKSRPAEPGERIPPDVIRHGAGSGEAGPEADDENDMPSLKFEPEDVIQYGDGRGQARLNPGERVPPDVIRHGAGSGEAGPEADDESDMPALKFEPEDVIQYGDGRGQARLNPGERVPPDVIRHGAGSGEAGPEADDENDMPALKFEPEDLDDDDADVGPGPDR